MQNHITVRKRKYFDAKQIPLLQVSKHFCSPIEYFTTMEDKRMFSRIAQHMKWHISVKIILYYIIILLNYYVNKIKRTFSNNGCQ